MDWKYKKMDIFEAVEIVKASPNEFVTQDVKIRNCVRAEDASYAVRQLLRSLWLARAMRAEGMLRFFAIALNMEQCEKWDWVERKCLEKAKEFE